MRSAKCAVVSMVVALWMGAIPAFAAAPEQTVDNATADAALEARIETTFQLNEYLNPANITTEVQGGQVTLSGSVDDEVQRDLAEQLALSIDGVDMVQNNLVVGTAPAPPAPRTWRQKVQDATVSAAVRSRLLYHREFKGLQIGVSTENGVVTLYGVVSGEGQKERIAQLAADTRGVQRVINNLTVVETEGPTALEKVGQALSDEWVEKRVETSILMNRHVSILDLNVDVADGVCVLTGTVDTAAQKELARLIAANTTGVTEVINDVHVRKAEAVAPPEPAAGSPESPVEAEDLP